MKNLHDLEDAIVQAAFICDDLCPADLTVSCIAWAESVRNLRRAVAAYKEAEDQQTSGCKCQGFFQPANCPVHGR